jgi:hypothetical protein
LNATPHDDPSASCPLPASLFSVFAAGRAFDRDAPSLAAAYEAALPFPHFVAEGLFEEAFLAEVVRELPHPSQGEGFVRNDSPDRQILKFAYRSEDHLGPRSRHLISVLHSKTFLDFLSKVTRIAGLVPDAHLCGGGFQQTLPGGRLEVHADFNAHPVWRLDRRLNLLLFLNRDWKEEYGGRLELWDAGMTRCVRSIPPRFNTTVVFGTNDTSFHGHPAPLMFPEGTTRKSLALYYYSNGRPETERSAHHSTLWQTRPEDAT